MMLVSAFCCKFPSAEAAEAAAVDEVVDEDDVEAATLAGGKEAAEFMEQDRFNLV